MSKFCVNCGAALDEGVAFCHNCGARQEAPVQPEQPAEPVAPVAPVAPAPQFVPAQSVTPPPPFVPAITATAVAPKKKVNPKLLIIGGAVVAAVVIVVIVLSLVLGGGPEKALDNWMAIYSGDVSKIEDMFPEEYWNYVAREEEMSRFELMAELRENLIELREDMKDEFGSNYRVSYEILDKEDVDKVTLQKIGVALARYGIKPSAVKEACNMQVLLSIQGSGVIRGSDDSNMNVASISAVKIDSDWYLIRYYEHDGEFNVYFLSDF